MALKGIRVLELAGLAPAPFCGLILADYGASVTRIDRAGVPNDIDVMSRGKRSLALNLKLKEGREVMRKVCMNSDVLIEPFRKGVMEKLGLGPDILMKDNPGLIYARLTGFGQDGPYSEKAGHDINYLAVSGLLSRLGRKDTPPLAPINLLADFAGGGMTCALGIMAALIDRGRTGKGQIIDSNMVEGAAYVGTWVFQSKDLFVWGKGRGENLLDSGAHFYETYETKDGKYMAVGALEPKFYSALLQGLEFSEEECPQFSDFDEMKAVFKDKFLSKTQSEWTKIFDKLDACVTPVTYLEHAHEFRHNQERQSFAVDKNGRYAPIPAPRLSNHPDCHKVVGRDQPIVGQHTNEILSEIGYSQKDIEKLCESDAIEIAKLSKL